MKSTEHDIQKQYFRWAAHIKGIELLHAIPNGGHRHPATAVKLKAEGVKAGVPDVYLPVSRGGFIGLAIEFKAPEGNPTKEQRDRIDRMQREGWCAVLCWDFEAARRVTLGYMGMLQLNLKDEN